MTSTATQARRIATLRRLIAARKPFTLRHIADPAETSLLIGHNKTSRRISNQAWRWT